MGIKVMMAGQDITAYVDETTIKIDDTLGQGAGVATGTGGKAATCEFTCNLGPVASAKGAGQSLVGGPYLVRQSEIIIYDAGMNLIFGGYAADYKDASLKTVVKTDVLCHDYWQHLDTIRINENYDGQTDIFIIRDLATKYAPWLDLSLLPTTPGFTFGPRNLQHFTLMKGFQNVVDTSGYQMWISPDKKVHYIRPQDSATAPFALSDTPNNSSTFPHKVKKYETDDNAAINRVYFYGGKHLTDDYTQDLSVQCNGAATVYTLAYYPHKAKDGKFHILKNGVEQVFGFTGGKGAANVLTTDGGTAHLLLNIDAHTIESDSAFTGGTTLQAKYRHEIPLVVVLSDKSSVAFFGNYFDGVVVDAAVFDIQTALQRCRVTLAEQSYGLTTLTVRCWRAGLQAGQTVRIDTAQKGIHANFIIQKVTTVPLGAGKFAYDVDCGAWNWNMVDLLLQTAALLTPADMASTEDNTPIQVEQLADSVTTAETVVKYARGGSGSYNWRTSFVGDGHDIKWRLWQW